MTTTARTRPSARQATTQRHYPPGAPRRAPRPAWSRPVPPAPQSPAARHPRLRWARIRSTARDFALVIGFVLFVSAGPHAHPPSDHAERPNLPVTSATTTP